MSPSSHSLENPPPRKTRLYSSSRDSPYPSSSWNQSNSKLDDVNSLKSISLNDRQGLKSRFTVQSHDESEETQDPDFTLVLPSNRLYIVIPGLMLCIFLAALDQTIITTAIPTIVNSFHDSSSSSWIGTAYSLAETAVLPFVGIMSEVVGRKAVLYTSIVIFLFGSALCGAAKSMIWLILCRAVQGIGGGGIMSLVTIVIADITPLQTRSYYTGCFGATWGIASVMGPLIGGAISQKTTWRWIFFINLPTGGIALTTLVLFLNLIPKPRTSFTQFLKTFDFVGIITITVGVVLFLLGLNLGSTTGVWKHANILCYLIIGILCLVVFAVNETYTKRIKIMPPSAFKTLSLTSVMVTSFLHYYIMSTITYYIPVYFQNIKGDGPLMSGVHTLSYAVVSSVTSAISGFSIGKLRNYKYFMIGGWIILLAGSGAMIAIYYDTEFSRVMGFIALTAVGVGNLFQPNLIALQASVPPATMATSCSAFMLLRNMGSSIGISIGGVIYDQQLSTLLKGTSYSKDMTFSQIQAITDVSKRNFVLKAFADAIRMIWIVNVPFAALGAILSFFVRQNKLSQSVLQYDEKKEKISQDGRAVEKP
ncbi:membrane transporter [Schizosaccharomyces cryophilus OY26]|uniref:Membrane transporter n=1 Tax=Schizosaccharomyces cryophilus (strain OY26 / ATCC MYA-4695 / CBS 11777 / NBRC 106824 / NRRL Y48691) TaxID=653667 RepID=S9VZB1_SCHCR|nr:membrane transporter [Schizosaccharomyces cryophilus OY26]EPY52968.1 membrane transporter [Schizosaccharomyces cryophilus OY26]